MNILIIGPSWVGDMVMAQTLFQCLKMRHPDSVSYTHLTLPTTPYV